MYWGYYCKTCNTSSARWAEDPCILREIYQGAHEKLEIVRSDQPLRAPTFEMQPLFFLSEHFGHEVWVESELAMFELPTDPIPAPEESLAASS